jgi:regulator of sigma E protease
MKVTALATTNILAVEFQRDGERFSAELTAEPNPVIGLKVLNLAPQDHPLVAEVMAGSAAESAGLIKGDKFISFGDVPVVGQAQLIALIQKRADKSTPMEIERDGKRLRVDVTPILDPDAGVGRIGVIITGSTIATYKLQRPGPTPIEQISIHLALLRDTVNALSQPKKSGVTPKDMAGPIGIAGMLAGEIGVDFRRALNLLVFLNLNLAILNLLPLPVLDGGHILMALYEMITRRKVSVRIQETVTAAFALLLISFMLFVTFNDFKRIPLLRSHIRQNSVVEGESTTNPNLEPDATNTAAPRSPADPSPPPSTLSPVEVP